MPHKDYEGTIKSNATKTLPRNLINRKDKEDELRLQMEKNKSP